MRHLKKKLKLSRSYDHARSLRKNLARSLFLHGKIKTTKPKAAAVVRLVERMVARGKRNELSGKRYLYSFFQDQNLVNDIDKYVIKRFAKNQGGITRSRKLKRRKGDNAIIFVVEFIDGRGGILAAKKAEEEKEKSQKKAKKVKKTKNR